MGKNQLRTVVVGVDFGSSGDEAIIEAFKWLEAGHVGSLHAVHVLDPRDVIDDKDQPALQTEEAFVEKAPGILSQRIAQLAQDGGFQVDMGKVHTHARIGKAAPAVHQVAIDYEADLIIVGTHGRQGFDRLVLGSVAESLVRTAHCPVLVAKPKDYSGLEKSPRPQQPYAPGEAPVYEEPSRDVQDHITTQQVSWSADEQKPTGVRIV